jgi:hypothetical protein
MKNHAMLLALVCLLSGCVTFRAPYNAKGPTVPTGTYDSAAEKWADEALARERKTAKEKTEKDLNRMNRELTER